MSRSTSPSSHEGSVSVTMPMGPGIGTAYNRRRMLFPQAVTCTWTPYFHDAYGAGLLTIGRRQSW
jgi:hypothetical protein